MLKVIILSSLLNTHRNASPGSVGGGLPGVNDMLTCAVQQCNNAECLESHAAAHLVWN